MCLILFAHDVDPQYSLIVAANRDEAHARPAAPAGFWTDDPRIYAGRDLEQGGTWLGLATTGRFAAITNYRQRPRAAATEHSRGELTRGYLTGDAPAQDYLRDVSARAADYRGFSLIAGVPGELYFYSNRGNGVATIARGVHGLSNHLLDEPWPKVRNGIAVLNGLLGAAESTLIDGLYAMLGDRTPAPDHLLPATGLAPERERDVSPAFIARDVYGTRASTVVLVGRDGHVRYVERSFGPLGAALGTTDRRFRIETGAVNFQRAASLAD
jgi:uncharacterized protein with NRDE domain